MINRHFKPHAFKPEFHAPPVQAITAATQYAQQEYDKNYKTAQELKALEIPALPQDRKRANELMDKYETRINELVQMYSGDYSKATQSLGDLGYEIARESQPGGEIDAIQQNYSAYTQWEKSELERVRKNEVSPELFSAARDYFYGNFKGTTKDPNTGMFSKMNPEPLAEYVDTQKIAHDIMDKVKPRTISTTRSVKRGNNWFNEKFEYEGIDENEAAQAVTSALVSNPKYTDYIDQASRFAGVPTEDFLSTDISNVVGTVVPLRAGVFKQLYSDEYKGMDDAAKMSIQYKYNLSLKQVEHRNAMARLKYKHDLDNGEEDGSMSRLKFMGMNQGAGPNFKPVLPQGGGLFKSKPGGFNIGFGGEASKAYPSVKEAMSNGNAGGIQLNMPALIQASNLMKGKPDANVWEAYNSIIQTEQDRGSAIYARPPRQPEQMKKGAEMLVPQILGGNFRVHEYSNGKLNLLEADKVNSAFGDMYDTNSNRLKPSVLWEGQSASFSGNTPLGDIITYNGKKYLVEANDERVTKYNDETRQDVFGHISSGNTFSKPFDFMDTTNGMNHKAIGVTEYESDSKGRVQPVTRYYPLEMDQYGNIKKDAFGQAVPNYKDMYRNPDNSPLAPWDVEEILTGRAARNLLPKIQSRDPKNPAFDYELND